MVWFFTSMPTSVLDIIDLMTTKSRCQWIIHKKFLGIRRPDRCATLINIERRTTYAIDNKFLVWQVKIPTRVWKLYIKNTIFLCVVNQSRERGKFLCRKKHIAWLDRFECQKDTTQTHQYQKLSSLTLTAATLFDISFCAISKIRAMSENVKIMNEKLSDRWKVQKF